LLLLGAALATGADSSAAVVGVDEAPEKDVPTRGAYAEGLRADARGDFAAATSHYGQALTEFSRAANAEWAERASRQRTLSSTLLDPWARVPREANQWRLAKARAFHEKFLSTRAFLREPTPMLARFAELYYQQILETEPESASAALNLAALHAAMGRAGQARQE